MQAQDPPKGLQANFILRDDKVLVTSSRLCVPNIKDLKKEIMEEAHFSAYAMHPGNTKMYKGLLLVARHKERDSIICFLVFSLPAD